MGATLQFPSCGLDLATVRSEISSPQHQIPLISTLSARATIFNQQSRNSLHLMKLVAMSAHNAACAANQQWLSHRSPQSVTRNYSGRRTFAQRIPVFTAILFVLGICTFASIAGVCIQRLRSVSLWQQCMIIHLKDQDGSIGWCLSAANVSFASPPHSGLNRELLLSATDAGCRRWF